MGYMDTIPLPGWMEPVEGSPGTYILDPDAFYPAMFALFGVEPEHAVRYDIEVAQGLAKKLARWHAVRCPHGAAATLIIRGDGGRKARWATQSFPVGRKPDISRPHLYGERNAAVYRVWNQLMG